VLQAHHTVNENSTHKVTGLLSRATAGDAGATRELFPLVYDELRKIAADYLERERAGHTLQPTALVHEAYLRLVGPVDMAWQNRAHFFGAAAQAIRRILVDHARLRNRVKRGGPDAGRVPLESADVAVQGSDQIDMIALDEALTRLAEIDEVKARVVELRYFAGLSLEETARALDVSLPTVSRYWEFARVWLHREMSRDRSG
jgi:RNA polymerase sigma-70 factor, ECF subfamily